MNYSTKVKQIREKNKKTFIKALYKAVHDTEKDIIHKQGLSMKEIIKKEGWNLSLYYLNWEVHYTIPHLALNKDKVIYMKKADKVSYIQTY